MQTKVLPLYYKSIDELPLNRFIDCLVDNNLTALIISGQPQDFSNEILSTAWGNIQSQYIERIGTGEYKMYVKLFKEIQLLKITLIQINCLAARQTDNNDPGILRLCYDEHLVGELNKLLKTTCTLNWKDPKSYHAELDKCINRSKAFKIQLDLKLLTFDAIEKKNQGKQTPKATREYFVSILVTLSDHAKYMIPDTIKMSEYCERLKRFNQACEKVK